MNRGSRAAGGDLDRQQLAKIIADRDLRRLVIDALDRGWTARQTGKKHIMLRHPSGAVVGTSGSQSGSHGRGRLNLRAAIARAERAAI